MSKISQLKLLSEVEVGTIFEKCVEFLSSKGVKVNHQQALIILDNAGARVDFDSQMVRFPKDIVETALKTVPHTLTIGDNIVPHPAGLFYTTACPGTIMYADPESNTYHDATLDDVREYAQLQNVLGEISFVVYPIPSDVPKETLDVHAMKTLFENTSKPMPMLPICIEGIEYVFEMAQVIAGSSEALKKKPLLLPIVDATTPFVYKTMDIEALIQSCRYRQPIQAAHVVIAGASAPITIAGQIVVAATEILATLVMSQLIEPGTPFIANSMLLRMDMATGRAIHGTENFLASAAIVQFYKEAFHVPTTTGGGVTDTYAIDGQSASEKILSGLLTAQAGCDILTGLGMVGGALATNPLQLIIDDTLARELKRIMAGVKVDDETLAWQDILDTGPGGNFLDRDHTFNHCREALPPALFKALTLADWEAESRKDLHRRALDKYRELKAGLQPCQLPEDVQRELNRIVKEADERWAK